MKQITITDSCYTQWVKDLAKRYCQSQIKAAVKVNSEMLEFYWHLGREIVETKAESRWGAHFFKNLSEDLRRELPDVDGFSQTNLLYMKNFYLLYSKTKTPQLGEQNQSSTIITPQLGEHFPINIFLIPWGHHKLLIDKFKNQQKWKA